ncbi:uncharacterized protein LOC111878670 [Lactuca sativa]|uniref:uncharacterized protein LOC111878670 n=1 Tax=Lactuca sativa TaxID=4236 RepID=UPI000CD7F998|nr:uncharacterized protein LOC111878670 [Lactuca sativa]
MDRLCSSGFAWKWRTTSFDADSLLELHEFHKLVGSVNLSQSLKVGFRFKPNSEGIYTVNSLRRMVDLKINQYKGPLICWSKSIHLKVKCFIWRSMERISVADALAQRGIMVQNTTCSLCGTYDESTNHLLIGCEFSNTVCDWIFRWCGIQHRQFENVRDLIDFAATWGNCPKKRHLLSMIVYSTIWNIWLTMNDRIFKKIGVNPTKTADSIIAQTFEWNKHRRNGMESWMEWSCYPFSFF